MKIEGYVIMQPSIIPGKVCIPHTHTFANTAGEAWRIHVGPNVDEMDISTRIQFWHDRGYRVEKATMEIEENE